MVNTSDLDLNIEGWPSIPEYYTGRSLFVTGGTGFMGKVLIEKLLRSCPDLRTIYLLLRPKRGKSLEERIRQLGADPLFERLREEQPAALSKLHVICGDVKDLGLGLNEEDRQLLLREVSVVFHSAASVRFDDSLKDAVLINVRGTREMLRLARQMHRLEVLVHVSTTFCNFNQDVVMEQIYPAPGNWRTMISLAESANTEHLLECLTQKVLGKSPNTYTYAKALSEQIVDEHKDLLPVIIVRPSIVLPTAEEPIPGWTDNFNGPIGLFLGGGKGILRTVYADPNHEEDYIQVDIAIRAFIVLAWHRALQTSRPSTLPVFNASKMTEKRPLVELINIALSWLPEYPLDNSVWHPNPVLTTNKTIFFVKVILIHMLPALLVDAVLKLSGRKPMLVKLQRRIYIANVMLSIFALTNCFNDNTKFLGASKFIKACDMKDFNYNKIATDAHQTFKLNIIGSKKYLLKDKLPLAESRRHYQRMYWLDRILKGATLTILAVVVCMSARTQALVTSVFTLAEVIIMG